MTNILIIERFDMDSVYDAAEVSQMHKADIILARRDDGSYFVWKFETEYEDTVEVLR